MSQTILVTGASSGIGQSTAQLLAERGFTVFGTARKPDAAKRAPFTMLRRSMYDRTSRSARAWNRLIAKAGRLDVLVQQRGVRDDGRRRRDECPRKPRRSSRRTSFGIVRMVNAVLPGMRAAGAGKIINISSLAGKHRDFRSAPSTRRPSFAVEGYSESLWHEVRPFGISVSLVEPGFVNTPIGEASPEAERELPAYNVTRKRMLAKFGRSLAGGIPPGQVARSVLQIVDSKSPGLRYRVGARGTWLPRLRNVVPWKVLRGGSAEDGSRCSPHGLRVASFATPRSRGATALRLSCSHAKAWAHQDTAPQAQ